MIQTFSMRKELRNFVMLLVASLAVASCLEDDTTEVTLYDDTAITAFSLTGADIYYHTLSSTGEDSVYSVSAGTEVTGCAFYIDQLKGEVFNVDSLPVGTDVSKMLCSLSTKNNGVPFIESLEPEDPTYLSSTDSVDFSEPRVVRIYSSDGTRYRSYTIRVNLHQEEPDSFVWKEMAACQQLATAGRLKACLLNDRLMVFAQQGRTTEVYSLTADGQWDTVPVTLDGEAVQNIVQRNDSLFILDGNSLKVTTDGQLYTVLLAGCRLTRLLGGNTGELYGMDAAGGLMVSADGGRSWSADRMGSDARLLPVSHLASVSLTDAFVKGTDYTVLAGNRDEAAYPQDRYAKVWRKIVDRGNSQANKWICVNEDAETGYCLPRLQNLQMFVYGGTLMAIGSQEGETEGSNAYSQFYESRDGGITWKHTQLCQLPAALDSQLTNMAVAVSADNFIWMVCAGTGQVWRGRLNRLGWKQ